MVISIMSEINRKNKFRGYKLNLRNKNKYD